MGRSYPSLLHPFLGLALLGVCACSAVQSVYQKPGYDVGGAEAVKRIAVGSWAPSDHAGLADILTVVTADLVKLRKNYLVYESVAIKQSWAELCGERQGVLLVRALDAQVTGKSVRLDLVLELYRCQDGALLWRAAGQATNDADDPDLVQLSESYSRQVGGPATQYAAPAFALLQQLIAELPNPTLTGADVDEKIELGWRPRRRAELAERR